MAALGGQATGLATLAAGIWDGLGRPWALGFIGAALVALGTAAELKTVRKVPRAG